MTTSTYSRFSTEQLGNDVSCFLVFCDAQAALEANMREIVSELFKEVSEQIAEVTEADIQRNLLTSQNPLAQEYQQYHAEWSAMRNGINRVCIFED